MKQNGLQIKSKVWIEKDGRLVFGSGKALILKHIERTGSIHKAAEKLGMSYRHAWSYIKSAEKRLAHQLLICSKGGKRGGGTLLTPYARSLLEKYEIMENKVRQYTDRCSEEILA